MKNFRQTPVFGAQACRMPSSRPCGVALLRCFLALSFVAGGIGHVSAHEPPHVHGAAELRIVVDGPHLQLALETPLVNVLGFEHAPRNEKQRAAVRAMAAKLRRPQELFTPTPAARCTAGDVRLESAVLAPELLGENKGTDAAASTQRAPAPQKEQSSEHADLDASFSWRCESPAQLKGIDVGLMKAFPGLRKLDVQVVGPRGQSATQVTPAKRSVTW
jgi:hypothetical protein